MEEVKNKVEALLFSSARSMSVEEISELVKVSSEDVKKALEELKKKYEDSKATELIQEGDHWKLTVRNEYVPLVTKIVTQTELSKTLMETLAVVAFKYPIKQSDVIKIRTNKAYDHLKVLEEQGYITRQKYGRTRLIKLAQKFFDYFDLPRDKLKEKFKDFGSLATAIEEKENLIEKMKQRKSEKEEKGKTEVIKEPEVDLVDEEGKKVKLDVVDEPEVYEEEKEEPVEVFEEKEKLGELEVVDELEEPIPKPEKKIEKVDEEEEKKKEEEAQGELEEESSDIIEELKEKKVKTDFEKEVDRRVDALLHPPKEESEEEIEEDAEEAEDLLEASQEEEKEKNQ